VTFADSVLHLVRSGARIDPYSGSRATAESVAEIAEIAELEAEPAEFDPADGGPVELAFDAAEAESHEFEPGLQDLEAAVALVSGGLANRVVLSGFQSWPGLLWRAYQLADTTGVLILPTVVRSGGRVDIVITRDTAQHG
jgi:hypothetical protein